MRYLNYLLISSFILVFFGNCKKESVDGSSLKNFQESINDISISLNTLEQTKLNEALYILKTFAVKNEESDVKKLEELAKLVNKKNVSEILALANEVAKKNNLSWSSTVPPSLEEANIFQNTTKKEISYNDEVSISYLDIDLIPKNNNSIEVPYLKVVPKLLDDLKNEITFSNEILEVVMEIYSNNSKIAAFESLNHFKGFDLKLSDLPKHKILDDTIDIKVIVKTINKNYQAIKKNVQINNILGDLDIQKPENVVINFLKNLNNQKFRQAYDMSDNPEWESFEEFSDPNSGFGGIKKIDIKQISNDFIDEKLAIVDVIYQVTDKDNNTTELNISYDLKPTEKSWKISKYTINLSEEIILDE